MYEMIETGITCIYKSEKQLVKLEIK